MSPPPKPSTLDGFLRLFADVRPGESLSALLLSGNVFLLLSAYYIIKPIRDGLIVGEFSAAVKSYTSAGAVFLLAIVVPLYGKLADRVPRRRLINVATIFFVVSFVGFYGLWATGLNIGIVFYAWVAVFNVMIVAQFWGFANDVYNQDEGERLFPIVAFGQSFGAVVGATYVERYADALGIGTLLLIGTALLFVQLLVTNFIDSRERKLKERHLSPEETSEKLTATTGSIRIEDVKRMLAEREAEDRTSSGPQTGAADTREKEEKDGQPAVPTSGAFKLVFQTRYLLMIGLLMMLLNLVNTTGEFILDSSIANAAAEITGQTSGAEYTQEITALKAGFFQVVNITGLIIQLFVVSRVVQYFGVAVGLMILPAIAIGGYGLIALAPAFPVIRWAKTAENATDYSLNNTVRNMLFLPATREQKYKAKQTIDSFFSRVGDTLQAVVVFVGTTVFALSMAGFAVINLSIAVVWFFLAYRIGKRYRHLVESDEAPS
jgi:AAA family ATP:ADP antiporter